MWIEKDYHDRIVGYNEVQNMEGNTGWFYKEGITPEDLEPLCDDHGACRYKLENGEIVLRSEEERKEDWVEPEPVDDISVYKTEYEQLVSILDGEE